LAAAFGPAPKASAHPHVFVDARAEVVFDGQGRIAAVRNIWQFDEAFSSYATLNLDSDGDGTFSPEELEPLAKINVESLQEFAFFTYLTLDEKELPFVPPSEYFLTYESSRLTLYYTLPLKEPAVLATPAKLEVFDPEYFVAFTFVGDEPAVLDGAPDGCTATFHPPQELDAQTMAILSAIPMDQRTIPDDLVAAASVLANVIVIECADAGLVAAPEAAPPEETPRPKPPSPFGVGTPDAPGGAWLTGPLGPFFIWIGQMQARFYKALTDRFAEIRSDPQAALLLLGLSFLYGVLHAAGPGHGKAVITSYLFATGETLRRGVALSFAAAFVQAFTAIAIVGAATLVFHAAASTVTSATQWIEIGSYALIVLVGLWLVWTKTWGGGHHHHHHRLDADGAARGDDEHHHEHHDHAHCAAHDREHAHDDHNHQPGARAASTPTRSSLVAAISAIVAVGVRPCTGAIIVLVFSFSLGMFGVGMIAALVMALGTGLTVAVLAVLAVTAHGFAMSLAGTDSTVAYRVVRGLEIAAAFVVLGFGVVLLGGALANGLPA
jgi:ABC-type nickel/cobalt efflux system permease component RcnA/ABC-type uncharacterized transport system substrate-binding protein